MQKLELNKNDLRILKSKLELVRQIEESRMERARIGNPKIYTPAVKKMIMIRYARTIRAINHINNLQK